MLKRTRDTVRAVAEAAGIIAPSVADAQAAAEAHREALVLAQSTLEAAEVSLQAAHDANADAPEISKAEAALASAKVETSRAEARYKGAENRLRKAQDAQAEGKKGAARVKLSEALAQRRAAAERIDAAAFEIAEAVAILDATNSALAECARDGVAAHVVGMISTSAMVQHAIERAGAMRSTWPGGRQEQPTASELNARIEGAALAA